MKKILLYSLLFVPLSLFGTTYTITTASTEANIQTALNSVSAGDTIQIQAGSHVRECNLLLTNKSGTLGNEIVIIWYEPNAGYTSTSGNSNLIITIYFFEYE